MSTNNNNQEGLEVQANDALVSNENAAVNELQFENSIINENNIQISLIPSKRKKVKKINMVIEGEFNISNAVLVKDNCNKLMQHFDFISITLKNITDIDLAAVQLLQVLGSSPAFAQKTITIDSELSKEDKVLLGNSGLMDVMSKQKNND